jgi:hypothetical protein
MGLDAVHGDFQAELVGAFLHGHGLRHCRLLARCVVGTPVCVVGRTAINEALRTTRTEMHTREAAKEVIGAAVRQFGHQGSIETADIIRIVSLCGHAEGAIVRPQGRPTSKTLESPDGDGDRAKQGRRLYCSGVDILQLSFGTAASDPLALEPLGLQLDFGLKDVPGDIPDVLEDGQGCRGDAGQVRAIQDVLNEALALIQHLFYNRFTVHGVPPDEEAELFSFHQDTPWTHDLQSGGTPRWLCCSLSPSRRSQGAQ